MSKTWKRALSLLLSLSMVMGLAVTSAMATGTGAEEDPFIIDGNKLTIESTSAAANKGVKWNQAESAYAVDYDAALDLRGGDLFTITVTDAHEAGEWWPEYSEIQSAYYYFTSADLGAESFTNGGVGWQTGEDAPRAAGEYKIHVYSNSTQVTGNKGAQKYYKINAELSSAKLLIYKADISTKTVTYSTREVSHDQLSTVQVLLDNKAVTAGSEYAIVYYVSDTDVDTSLEGAQITNISNLEAGKEYYAAVGGKKNFKGTAQPADKYTLKVTKPELNNDNTTIEGVKDLYYTAKPQTISATVKLNGNSLTKDTHYKLGIYKVEEDAEIDYKTARNYADESGVTESGTYQVYVVGIGSYGGSVEQEFEVKPVTIDGVYITVETAGSDGTLKNAVLKAHATSSEAPVTADMQDFVKFTWTKVAGVNGSVDDGDGADYSVGADTSGSEIGSDLKLRVTVTESDEEAKRANVQVTGSPYAEISANSKKLDDTDTVTKSWPETQTPAAVKYGDGNKPHYQYDSQEKTPVLKFVLTEGGAELVENRDFTMSYKDNVNAGSNAKAFAVGQGDYYSSASDVFVIHKAYATASTQSLGLTVNGERTVTVTTDGAISSTSIIEAGVAEVVGDPAGGTTVKVKGLTVGSAELKIETSTGVNYYDTDEATTAANLTITVTVSNDDPPRSSFDDFPMGDPAPGTSTTTTNKDGSTTTTTKDAAGNVTTTTTAKDGSQTVETKMANGSTGKVETDALGNTVAAEATVSEKAVSDAVAAGEAVKLPVEVKAASSAASAAEIDVTMPSSSGPVTVEVPVSNVSNTTVAILVGADGKEQIVKMSAVSGDGVLLALSGSATLKIVDNAKSFNDVAGHWAESTVAWAASHEIMNGMGDGGFSPDTPMSRAMLAQMLFNVDGATGGHVTTAFADVRADQWFAESVTWALENGVAQGDGTNFNPDQTLTREQMVVMLYNYAKGKGYDTTPSASLGEFTDAGNVASWAQDAMAWAVDVGLIGGMGDGTVAPQGNATRAQLATIMQRFAAFTLK